MVLTCFDRVPQNSSWIHPLFGVYGGVTPFQYFRKGFCHVVNLHQFFLVSGYTGQAEGPSADHLMVGCPLVCCWCQGNRREMRETFLLEHVGTHCNWAMLSWANSLRAFEAHWNFGTWMQWMTKLASWLLSMARRCKLVWACVSGFDSESCEFPW